MQSPTQLIARPHGATLLDVPERANSTAAGPGRVLIVRLSSLGDIVHALPVACALRRAFPAARLTWVVEEPAAELVARHPAVDRVVVFPPGRWRALGADWLRRYRAARRALRDEPYDVALDLQGLARSAAIALQSRAARRLGAPRQREGAGWISQRVPLPTGGHVVDEYLACAAALGASTTSVEFALTAEAEARDRVAARLRGRDGRALITVNPSSARAAKNWPHRSWAATVAALSDMAAVVLIGNDACRRRHAALAKDAPGSVLDLTGQTTLGELVALLDCSDLHIASDTGSLHIAAALGRPVLGLYGPTAPTRAGPYGQPGNVLYRGGCAPSCPDICPRRRRCLAAITVDDVLDKVQHILRHERDQARPG